MLRLCGCERQGNANGGALANLTLGFDLPAMQMSDVFHDRKAETGAAQLTMTRFVGGLIGLGRY